MSACWAVERALARRGFLGSHLEDLLANLLRRILDLLHGLADAGSGGLVAANRFGHIVGNLFDQTLKLLVLLNGGLRTAAVAAFSALRATVLPLTFP